LIEFILGDFHTFHALLDNLLIHDIGTNFIDQGSELFADMFVVDYWELVDLIECKLSVSEMFYWW